MKAQSLMSLCYGAERSIRHIGGTPPREKGEPS